MKILIKTVKVIGYVVIGIAWTVIILGAFTLGAMWLIGAGYQH